MTISRRPSPFGELLSLRQAMDRLFEDSFVRPRGSWGQSLGDGGLLPTTARREVVVERLGVAQLRPGTVPGTGGPFGPLVAWRLVAIEVAGETVGG